MPRLALPMLLAIGVCAGPALAASEGAIGTLTIGRYTCERPGNAGAALALPDPEASFAISSSSRYVAADGSYGTYLLTGDIVTMTSGKLAGTRLQRRSGKFLRRIEADGRPGALRCVLERGTDPR